MKPHIVPPEQIAREKFAAEAARHYTALQQARLKARKELRETRAERVAAILAVLSLPLYLIGVPPLLLAGIGAVVVVGLVVYLARS